MPSKPVPVQGSVHTQLLINPGGESLLFHHETLKTPKRAIASKPKKHIPSPPGHRGSTFRSASDFQAQKLWPSQDENGSCGSPLPNFSSFLAKRMFPATLGTLNPLFSASAASSCPVGWLSVPSVAVPASPLSRPPPQAHGLRRNPAQCRILMPPIYPPRLAPKRPFLARSSLTPGLFGAIHHVSVVP